MKIPPEGGIFITYPENNAVCNFFSISEKLRHLP